MILLRYIYYWLLIFAISIPIVMVIVFILPATNFSSTDFLTKITFDGVPVVEKLPEPVLPKKVEERPVSALYLTAFSAASDKKMDEILTEVEIGKLNSLVIDLKDYTGNVYFDTQVPLAVELGTRKVVNDSIPELIQKLHEKGIYVIARITVFQDPRLAELKPEWAIKDNVTGGHWQDYKGLTWVDPTLESVWQYNIDLAKDAVRLGFDEINFDYIRFPSDGPIKRMQFQNWNGAFPKSDIITGFFASMYEQLKDEPVYLSADLFGLTTIRKDDMNIGQVMENAAPFFHYICPMMYPSHYPTGFMNFENPADHPYEILKDGIEIANERLEKVPNSIAKIRPWIQDFDIGAVYDREKIQLQIKAIKDGNGYGYLSWNARNIYKGIEYKPELYAAD